jgi:DNA polymerase-1
MATTAQTLYLIDGHAQLYRAYHAVPNRMFAADRKTPTNAVFGFANMMRSLRTRFKPDLLAAVFDPHGPVKREQLYQAYADKLGKSFSGYKTQRDAMPDDLRPQIDLALELCEAYGVPALQIEGYEADDVLGTMALIASAKGMKTVIVTGDKDLLQLVCDDIRVYDPMKDIFYDEETVLSLKGVKPCQITDWLGFMGDSTDNIPGVSGIGDQTAAKLLQAHGSMDKALEDCRTKFKALDAEIMKFVSAHEADSEKPKEQRTGVKPPKGVKVVEAYLYAQHERARASRDLARLCTDLPLEMDVERFHCRPPEAERLAPLLKRLEFQTFLRDLDPESLKRFEVKAAETAVPTAPPAETHYETIDDEKKLADFAKQLGKQKRIAISVLASGRHPREARLLGAAFTWSASSATYLPFAGPLNDSYLDIKPALTALAPALTNPDIEKIGHDLKFIVHLFENQGVALRGVAFDSHLGSWLLDPGAARFSLEELAYQHLGVRKAGADALIGKGKNQLTLDLVPVADAAAYACQNADFTWQITEKLKPLLDEAGISKLVREIEIPLIDVLADMESTGIRVDGDLLRKMSKTLEQSLAAQETDIYEIAGEKFNISSPSQLGAILFDKLGLESSTKTSTGKNSTSEEVLTELASKHELPRKILDYRAMHKLKNTYVDKLPELISKKTGRIHATFVQTGAETGRLASHDPNLQNIPIRSELGRSIRAAFKPGVDGWKILAADYSQIELRILAHYCQDPALLDAFSRGIDIHTAVAAGLFGCSEKDVTREQRAKAKAVNFGIIYGQSAFGLSGTLSISRREAQDIITAYFQKHPGVQRCKDQIIAEAREQGYVTTVMGRRRFIPQLRASDRGSQALGERLAVNTVFQGSAADLIKKAMIDIHRELKANGWKAAMLLQIHDELLFECPPAEVKKLTEMVKRLMEGALKLNVPIIVEAGAGEDWLSAKD